MADETISLETLRKTAENLAAQFPDLSRRVLEFADTLEKAGQRAVTSTEFTNKFGDAAASVARGLNDLYSKLANTQFDVERGIDHLTQKLSDFVRQEDQVGIKALYMFEPLMHIIPTTVDAFGKLGREAVSSAGTIQDAYKGVAPYIENIFGKGSNAAAFIKDTVAGADSANALERNIISLSARSGDLYGIMSKTGQLTGQDLSDAYGGYVKTMYNVSEATGLTMDKTMQYSQSLAVIPGALYNVIHAGAEHDRQLNQLDASLKLASAYGLEHVDVVKGLSTVYQNFGTRGTEAFEALNGMYLAAQNTQLPIETVTQSVQASAEKFKLLGDNTKAATTIVEAFGLAFKDSNIGPKGIEQVISSMTTGLAKMSEGQKAFVSATTGGPGGLAGGFQIDYAMQQGRMDEVLAKAMDAMQRSFGGPILTLKDAASNPAQAGELFKQVKYLTDVTGLASNKEEAYRILEAMQKGALKDLAGGVGRTEGGELGTALDRGANIQDRSRTVLNSIYNELALHKAIQSGIQANTARMVMGTESRMGEVMIDSRERASVAAARGGALGTTRIATGANTDLNHLIGEAADTTGDSLKKMVGFLKNDLHKEVLDVIGRGESEVKRVLEPVGTGKAKTGVRRITSPLPTPITAGLPKPTAKAGSLPMRTTPQGVAQHVAAASAMGFAGAGTMPAINVNPVQASIDVTIHIPDLDTKVKHTINTQLKNRESREHTQVRHG